MDIFQQLEMQLYDEEFDPSYEPSQEGKNEPINFLYDRYHYVCRILRN